MRNVIIKSFFVLSLIAISVAANSQEAMLKYGFVKDKIYVLSTQLNNNVTQTMGGQEMKIEAVLKSNSEIQVENVDNSGNTTMLVSLKNASVSTKIPAMGRDTTMNFNDLNEQKRVTLSTSGTKVSASNISAGNISQMIGSAEQFTKFIHLPEKSIKFGEKWNEKLVDSTKASQQNPVNMVITTDMELSLVGKEVVDGVELLKITYSGALQITGKGNQMGTELFVEGNGKSEGFAYFNPKSSLIVRTETNTEMDMNIAVSGQQNMSMPMNQSMKTITTLVEK